MSMTCPITGLLLNSSECKVYPSEQSGLDYENSIIGRVFITDIAGGQVRGADASLRAKLAGISRNAFEGGKDKIVIDTRFLSSLESIKTPITLREKAAHLLEYMFARGGKDFESFVFSSVKDYPIPYASNAEEFNKVIKHLEVQGFIRIGNELVMAAHMVRYKDVVMTDAGLDEVTRLLPSVPLIGLIECEIATGDESTDLRINHARKLFFQQPYSMDNMRSACEALSHVLEPLRDELKKFFLNKDVASFFNIVNDFDIRHNKEQTKTIIHSEQLEWVFYTLLNTISTYVKLKRKLS